MEVMICVPAAVKGRSESVISGSARDGGRGRGGGHEPGRLPGVVLVPGHPTPLWEIIERFELFESWWGWLTDFRADGEELVNGNLLHGTVVPPVPYRLRLDVLLQRCERPRLVEAAIGGDLRGLAALRLEAADDGMRAEVTWSVEMYSAPLRIAAHIAYPLMRWGHDCVVDMAVAGFRQQALPATAAKTQQSHTL